MVNDNLMYALPLTFLFYLKAGAIGVFAIAQIYTLSIDDLIFNKFFYDYPTTYIPFPLC